MTAVASPPSFSNLNRPAWGVNGGQPLNAMNNNTIISDAMLRRSNSASSVSSNSSTSSTSTVVSNAPQTNGNSLQSAGNPTLWSTAQPRKRPQPKGQWPAGKPEGQPEFVRPPAGRPPVSTNGMNGGMSVHQSTSMIPSQGQVMSYQMPRPGPDVSVMVGAGQPVLYLLSLNGTFERKTISVPFSPDTLRIGRQTNAKTVPTPVNGYFDSKVLSRQHAEIWADKNGKIWIRDIKSSNGTFVNGTRLSQENRESEPHELQTSDHLELGIDIVNEDQKTVVHHKVAAKVEHAGFITPSNNPFDLGLGFPDSDLTNNAMLPPTGGSLFRPRTGSQASVSSRMAPAAGVVGPQANGAMHQRHLGYSGPVTTDHILKRLHNEMRNARLQNQDLARTGQFISALLTKDDVKNADKADGAETSKTHANGVSFRSEGGKTRFSDPPAPPPSQPLPEKPDIPSLKRVTTERPKSQTRSISPGRQENFNQILQLTEALQSAKKEIDSHSARVRELEEMFQKEREARLMAEDLARKIEESTAAKSNGSAEPEPENATSESELDRAFDLPAERPLTPEPGMEAKEAEEPIPQPHPQPDPFEAASAIFQSRIDSMVTEMMGLREQLEMFRLRAEKAEAERDEDRKTLAEMVIQIRKRDEDEQKRAAERKSRSPSKSRSRPTSRGLAEEFDEITSVPNGAATPGSEEVKVSGDYPADSPTLSRANTITPANTEVGRTSQDPALIVQSLPYASMVGVVLLGMGLMAYMNGWQPQPRLDR